MQEVRRFSDLARRSLHGYPTDPHKQETVYRRALKLYCERDKHRKLRKTCYLWARRDAVKTANPNEWGKGDDDDDHPLLHAWTKDVSPGGRSTCIGA